MFVIFKFVLGVYFYESFKGICVLESLNINMVFELFEVGNKIVI